MTNKSILEIYLVTGTRPQWIKQVTTDLHTISYPFNYLLCSTQLLKDTFLQWFLLTSGNINSPVPREDQEQLWRFEGAHFLESAQLAP